MQRSTSQDTNIGPRDKIDHDTGTQELEDSDYVKIDYQTGCMAVYDGELLRVNKCLLCLQWREASEIGVKPSNSPACSERRRLQ